MRILTALSVAILASANAVAADQPAADADKAAIQALEDTYNEGFNSKDVDKVMSVYVPGKELFVFDVVPPREYKGWEAYKKDFEGIIANLERRLAEYERRRREEGNRTEEPFEAVYEEFHRQLPAVLLV